MRSRPRAFSLTELLIVLSILLILASFLTIGIGTTYTAAQRLRCQQNLEQINQRIQELDNSNSSEK